MFSSRLLVVLPLSFPMRLLLVSFYSLWFFFFFLARSTSLLCMACNSCVGCSVARTRLSPRPFFDSTRKRRAPPYQGGGVGFGVRCDGRLVRAVENGRGVLIRRSPLVHPAELAHRQRRDLRQQRVALLRRGSRVAAAASF